MVIVHSQLGGFQIVSRLGLSRVKVFLWNTQSLIYGLRRVGLNPTEEEIRDMINQVASTLLC